ncbi:DNA (cytosine-5)-methyltransferase 1 [Pseudomonas sp. NFACC32-1]|uniref:DNA cytosine methyltransferase n=1 Tax=unclassified Pseudomonas TaxID=196821 RepID=UPI0008766338|nr:MULTISPECIES: DNA cytosine methyltransferase [unclassified Pseudomonas]ROO38120.1 DNA (cytosine-5-)-methyltransferase [Pseudomonas sp. 7SR1]SCX72292.1 DNA (cytosine-5)-methyltransferase 1 [Pseudomonas sp. NFACC32-1]SIR94771.1 DNA (cytosine-5)-methyltransferase 1 [Pseudomonas sp. 7SR1]
MPTLLDLFSGCGGLALGSQNAGFKTCLAVDIDPILSSSFPVNFPTTPFLHADVSTLTWENIRPYMPEGVDGIVGGPPCQAFSSIGKRLPDDPRRSLVGHFFRIVEEVQPKFFVMENVPGLAFPENRPVLDEGLSRLGSHWKVLGPVILDASNFGAPTKRKRVFVFGFNSLKLSPPDLGYLTESASFSTTVLDAINDLKNSVPLGAGGGGSQWVYGKSRKLSEYAKRMRAKSGSFTGHQRTVHKAETKMRFSTVPQGGVDTVGKHKRLEWCGLCPTLRAGTGSDRGSYQAVRPLHPDEDRVITPREAARLQGFHDDFIFHPTTWHSFRMIGNSVSPIIAEALLTRIKHLL